MDFPAARDLLDRTFAQAEADCLSGSVLPVSAQAAKACDVVFRSTTQAYREVLLGCLVARVQDKSIDIRRPYSSQGPNAFSGRTLDERVVNPFLQANRIPCTRSPYLSVFRRSVELNQPTRDGLRDKSGYDALLQLLDEVESTSDDAELKQILRHVLYRFAQVREETNIPLSRLQRLSLEQYGTVIEGLLSTPSGGRFPVMLLVAAFEAIRSAFNLSWEIAWQDINVADRPSGVAGDITISIGGKMVMSAEVTERAVDRARVVSTFNTKIAPVGLEDYLFFVKSPDIADEAKQQARQYFAQGHEINFLEMKQWMLMALATSGKRGRASFNDKLILLLDKPEVPKVLKVRWNELMNSLASA